MLNILRKDFIMNKIVLKFFLLISTFAFTEIEGMQPTASGNIAADIKRALDTKNKETINFYKQSQA